MKDTPTPRTDAKQKLKDIIGDEYVAVDFARQLERELTEANEYADKLAAGLPDGMLPKDVGVLREANLELAVELTAVTEQRDRLDDQVDHILLRLGRTQERMIDAERQRDRLEAEIRLTIMENVHLADGDVCTLKRLKDAIGFEFNEALQPLKTTEL